MKLLALDFDGVISDSAPESFAVALRTWVAMRPGSRWRIDPLADASRTPALDAIRDSPLYRAFLRHMPLGNRAEDYGVVLSALESEVEIPDQEAYDAYRAGHDADWMHAYHERFYRARHALAERDPEGWRALMAPYPELVALIRRRRNDAQLAIATAKDRRSVGALLRAYGIDDLFSEDRVLDKETGVGKHAHLTHLRERCGLSFEEMTFVDDKVNHLDAVAHLGVRCALAAWGYNGEREVALARARGYLVCELSDAERRLYG